MSVAKVRRKSGYVWRVRWRDAAGNEHSHVCGSKRDAEAYDAEVKRRKRMGDLAQLEAGRQTVGELAEEWWRLHAEPNLSKRTLNVYATLYDKHIDPRIGSMRVRDVTPKTVADLQAALQAEGVGPSATRKALFLLQGMFTHAVTWGQVPTNTNPVTPVKKPSGRRVRPVIVLSPARIEEMRANLRAGGRFRDATLVCVLAYAGLRPGEALALRWGDIGERVIHVERATNVGGETKRTKTHKVRSVRLVAPLVADLAEWRLASGRPAEDALVFPSASGAVWHDHDWKNWTRRVYKPVCERVGASGTRPYDLRHSFCSLLLHEGRSVVEVAAQAGHAPSMTLDTYGHVIAELDGAARVPAEAAIRAARDADVSEKCPPEALSAVG